MTTTVNNQRILLISNSTLYGGGFLDHAQQEISNFLGKVRRVLFIPFALHDHDVYSEKVRTRFISMGYELDSLHEARDKPQAVRDAATIFIGGGNTFRLLNALYEFEIVDVIREKVKAGMPYIGSSAGSNVAAPTIKTTNDMPIVEPPSFEALNLVSFQINPHYLDPEPDSKHMGETREERIVQFLEENDTPVVGLREGAMIRMEVGAAILKGSAGARIFQKGREPIEVKSGTRLNDYFNPTSSD